MANEIKRKEFIGVLGKGAIAAAILSFLPLKIFSSISKKINSNKRKTEKRGIKITINPSAVKRNKG